MEQKYDHSSTYQFRLREMSKNKGTGFEIKNKFCTSQKIYYIGYSLEFNVLNTHWHWFSDSTTG